MANEEHKELLKQGVDVWNQWREKNPDITPDLSSVKLDGADLREANLYGACLSAASLRGVILYEADLRGVRRYRAELHQDKRRKSRLFQVRLDVADLEIVDLRDVDLSKADLRRVNLSGATLFGVDFENADFSGVDLRDADLCEVDLREAKLRGAKLCGFDLSGLDLSGLDLHGVDLCDADLSRTQVLRTNFERAIFTGACLEDWHSNSATKFDGAICDYVYLKANQKERRPREGIFKSGEFAALFQQAVDTIDLIFKDGIDWQAFFQSFQELRSQYVDRSLSIQAIEKKRGGAFVVRVEVEGTDKSAIESSAKQLYETRLTLLEQRYRADLQAKEGEIVAYREQSANLMKITEMLAARPPMSEGNKYDLRGAQFGGGYVAGNVEGNQYGGIINNYGSNAEDITRLLTALRDQARTFPTDQKDDANDVLDDLERDLAEEQPDQGRIGRRLKRLVALGAAIGTIASGAAAVSGDVSMFTGNVIELTEQLGIPIEQVQLPPSGTP